MFKLGISAGRVLRLFGTAALCGSLASAVAWAQNPFAVVAQVDDRVITEFEIQQRARFLQVLNAPGSNRASVIEALIEDRLRAAEIQSLGVEIDDESLEEGLAEFAARTDLTTEGFIEALNGAGVQTETFRDFVAISILWRDYIRARFGNRVQIDEEEIDRAVAQVNNATGIEVLVSEIIIPIPPGEDEAVLEQADIISQSESEAEFSSFARSFSATASRDRGGRLDWVPISSLPASLRPILLALGPGDVTAPLPIPDAVALFQLRDIRETGAPEPQIAAIEYAAYYINGGRSPEALQIAGNVASRVDRCDDLYGVAQGQPENVLERGTLPPEDIPDDIAIELAKLDPGEHSTALTRANGNTLVFLMLCGRTPVLEDEQEVNRAAVASQLRNQRLAAFSDNLIAELEAEADIILFE